jgi:hypothetical protein
MGRNVWFVWAFDPMKSCQYVCSNQCITIASTGQSMPMGTPLLAPVVTRVSRTISRVVL